MVTQALPWVAYSNALHPFREEFLPNNQSNLPLAQFEVISAPPRTINARGIE